MSWIMKISLLVLDLAPLDLETHTLERQVIRRTQITHRKGALGGVGHTDSQLMSLRRGVFPLLWVCSCPVHCSVGLLAQPSARFLLFSYSLWPCLKWALETAVSLGTELYSQPASCLKDVGDCKSESLLIWAGSSWLYNT